MKTKLCSLVALLFISSVFAADTNAPPFFVYLFCGDRTFTNATIVKANPAYANIESSGGYERIATAELPEFYRDKYGYSPFNAAAFLADQKQKATASRAKALADQRAYQKYKASLVGTNRAMRINAIVDKSNNGIPMCDTSEGKILVRNIPAGVEKFLDDYQRLKINIADFEQQVKNDARAADRAQAAAPDYVSGNAAFVNAAAAQMNNANQMVVTANHEAEDLETMKSNLEKMELAAPEKTRTTAYPTGEFLGLNEIWVCSE